MNVLSYLLGSRIKSTVELSVSQKKLLKVLEQTDGHIFVTGKAGTGKSTLLKEYKRRAKKNVVIVAPTGIAALNVGGQTIHALFRFGLGVNLDKPKLSKSARLLLTSIDILIVDEVSMVRADVIDAIDKRLRLAGNNNLAFGGVRLVMFGDLYQLPPIVSDPKLRDYLYALYGSIYFFNAIVWKTADLKIYELDTVYRQADQGFKDVLNQIREGSVSQASLDILNSRLRPLSELHDEDTILSSTNNLVEEINNMRLNSINSKEYVYKQDGKEVRLKKGARIMLTKNDRTGRYVNGSLGTVKRLSKRFIWVKVNNRTIRVSKAHWLRIEYVYNERKRELEEKELKTAKKFPIKLAWAITIHKSQGQTYERCAIDLKSGAFAHGQAYVALSRCKSLDGLTLLSPVMKSDISVDPLIKEFMKLAVRI